MIGSPHAFRDHTDRRVKSAAPAPEDRVLLLVEPSISQRYLLRALFESRGFRVVSAKSAAEADTKICTQAVSLALVSWELPDASVFTTIGRWRRDPNLGVCSIFVMDSCRDPRRAYRARTAGAIDLIERPCSSAAIGSIEARLGRWGSITHEAVALQHRNRTPEFSVPMNDRTILMRRIRSELDDARLSCHPLSLGLLSLENLTDIKIERGREFAERIMGAVEDHLWRRVRACDLVARHTGSEFALLMPYTDRQGADAAMRRICETVGSRVWGDGEVGCDLGATTGTGTHERGGSSPIDLVRASVASLGKVRPGPGGKPGS